MRSGLFHSAIALILVISANMAFADNSKNLVPDAAFERAAKLPVTPPADADPIELIRKQTWKFYEIELPATAKIEKGKATLTGGKSFLHSAPFDVEPGKSYTIQVKAKGTGNLSVGLLWWEVYDDKNIRAVQPHWSRTENPETLDDEPIALKQTFTAPKDAKRAYLRIVVSKIPEEKTSDDTPKIIEDGKTEIVISNVSVTAQ